MTLLIWLLFVSYPLILSRDADGCFITIEGFSVTLFTSVHVSVYIFLYVIAMERAFSQADGQKLDPEVK